MAALDDKAACACGMRVAQEIIAAALEHSLVFT
jgi:hypothetical protein